MARRAGEANRCSRHGGARSSPGPNTVERLFPPSGVYLTVSQHRFAARIAMSTLTQPAPQRAGLRPLCSGPDLHHCGISTRTCSWSGSSRHYGQRCGSNRSFGTLLNLDCLRLAVGTRRAAWQSCRATLRLGSVQRCVLVSCTVPARLSEKTRDIHFSHRHNFRYKDTCHQEGPV